MRVRYSAAAEAELAEAVDWYARPDDGERLADRFLDERFRFSRSRKSRAMTRSAFL
jgi:plasmid stabilization system protein ParE